jgi:hypothetical protein
MKQRIVKGYNLREIDNPYQNIGHNQRDKRDTERKKGYTWK